VRADLLTREQLTFFVREEGCANGDCNHDEEADRSGVEHIDLSLVYVVKSDANIKRDFFKSVLQRVDVLLDDVIRESPKFGEGQRRIPMLAALLLSMPLRHY